MRGAQRVSGLFVIARASSFAYASENPNLKSIASELGVRFVLTGSLRTEDQRIRDNAQLVDTTRNVHIWAERYDRDFADILILQSEITQKIVSELSVTLTQSEQQ